MSDDEKLLLYLKKVTAELAAAKEQLARQGQDDDPVVIVSAGCRFAGGVADPGRLWSLVTEERDVVGTFPRDRGWDDRVLSAAADGADGTFTDRGAFIHDAADFDEQAFGISPREALAMDPQQRLTLEVAWETIERAGIPPTSLRGSRTGVFVGATDFHYGGDYVDPPEELAGHLITGNVTSVLSGRVSYALGLEGPAITLDTACSSALVALHLAARSLRAGECDAALVGGACIMSSPGVFLEFGRQRGLAPDGRCKSFADAADGTGWGEGVGLLLVERASTARRLRHPVLAVVRGSAINQDGASNGLTAPNGLAQRRVVAAALADAGLAPGDIDVVEAHGTGTRLGDPIEANALIEAYGQGRDPERPLWLGSVKSNLAHTQAAAGAGSLIKMVLALQHEFLPRTLHVDTPSREVYWSRGGVELLRAPRPWLRDPARPRRCGVSGFGVSGTNAHVILEEHPREPVPADDPAEEPEGSPWPGPVALPVSAWGSAARSAQAAAVGGALSAHDLAEVAHTLATGRAHLPHRAVVVAADEAEAAQGLTQVARGEAGEDVLLGEATGGDLRPVFVFPGQGSQWVGMGAQLLEASPVFARRLAECDAALAPHVDYSVVDLLRRRDEAAHRRVDVVQPLLWAVMVSLVDVWRAHGVEPAGVIGHSQGEIAAAVACGALGLEDAAAVCARRSRAILPLTGRGGMLSVAAPAADIAELVAGLDADVSLAARNGPSSVVLSGAPDALEAIRARADAAGIRARLVDVDYASHSSQVDEIVDGLVADLAGIAPRRVEIPFYSSVDIDTARDVAGLDTAGLDAAYWADNLRHTVAFEDAVRRALDRGHRLFVEVSPHPVLALAVESTAQAAGVGGVTVTGTLRRDTDDTRSLARSLATAHVAGVDVDLDALVPTGTPRVDLPTYRFQRSRYWYVPQRATAATDDTAHEVQWWAHASAPGGADGRRLVLVTQDAPHAPRLVEALGERLGTSKLDVVPATWEGAGDALAAALRAAPEDLAGIVLVAGPTGDATAERIGRAVHAVIRASLDAGVPAPLWLVTSAAEALAPGEAVAEPGHALARALCTAWGAERPGGYGGCVDLADDREAPRAVDVLLQSPDGGRHAVRDGLVHAARLVPSPARTAADGPWAPSGSVLVTGGLGGVGADVTGWLAEQGARHLVVLCRSGAQAGRGEAVAERVRAAGATLSIVAGDAADRGAVDAALADLPEGAPLTAVFHLAGELADSPVADLTEDALTRVLRGKADGARVLDEATADLPLAAFVVFSAAAGVLCPAGQGHYAAANAYADAVVAARRGRGAPACSVAWSAWAPPGMVDEDAARALVGGGVRPFERARGLDALEAALARGEDHVLIADIVWPDFLDAGAVRAGDPLLAELARVHGAARGEAEGGTELAAALSEPGADVPGLVRGLVADATARVLGFDGAAGLPTGRSFKDLGIDSLTAVRLRNRIAAATGLELPVTLAFDHPDIDAVAAELTGRLTPSPDADLLSRLDDLEQAAGRCDDLPPRTRAGLRSRLRALDRRLGADASGPADAAPEQPVDATSDEEMFALLDRELDSTT